MGSRGITVSVKDKNKDQPQKTAKEDARKNEDDYSFSKLWKGLAYSKVSYAIRAGVEAIGGTAFLVDGIASGRVVNYLVAGILYVGAVGNFMDYRTTNSLEKIANHSNEMRHR